MKKHDVRNMPPAEYALARAAALKDAADPRVAELRRQLESAQAAVDTLEQAITNQPKGQ